MSLLLQRKGPAAPLPRLEGKEVLIGPNPDFARVKGVMFGGRKQLLAGIADESEFAAIIAKLSPKTASYTKTPLASSWCEFSSLIELDRTIYETLKHKHPNILALIGAASAELGIGRVYKSLDSTELVNFLESQALFHSQFQKFGNVRFEKTPNGGRMICSDYPVYSPIYCASAAGFYLESILRHGGTDPSVVETKCQTLGDAFCSFEMNWR
jgi:hypothetical protein